MKTIKIYDVIGGFDGITAAKMIDEIGDEKQVTLRINSPGGVVSEALSIFNYLTSTGRDVTVYVDGYAASAASVIMLAASAGKLNVFPSSIIMLHKPSNIAWGNADVLRKEADVLDIHEQALVNIYKSRMKKMSEDEIKQLVNDESWMLGDAAVSIGIADNLVEQEEQPAEGVAACASFAAIHRKAMEVMMTKQETRKEITAQRDDLTAKVESLGAALETLKADFETAKASEVQAKQERDEIKAKYESALAEISAEKQSRADAEAALTKRIDEIKAGLANPALIDAAMKAADITSIEASDSEADAAEKKIIDAAKAALPKTKYEEFKAMPFGEERSAFYAKNKKQIMRDIEALENQPEE